MDCYKETDEALKKIWSTPLPALACWRRGVIEPIYDKNGKLTEWSLNTKALIRYGVDWAADVAKEEKPDEQLRDDGYI